MRIANMYSEREVDIIIRLIYYLSCLGIYLERNSVIIIITTNYLFYTFMYNKKPCSLQFFRDLRRRRKNMQALHADFCSNVVKSKNHRYMPVFFRKWLFCPHTDTCYGHDFINIKYTMYNYIHNKFDRSTT